MMNSTRSKSVINIFVLRLLPEQTGMVLFFQARSQPEDTHLDDEEYAYPLQECSQYICDEALARADWNGFSSCKLGISRRIRTYTTRTIKSVINIFVLSLLRNQPEDAHLDDEEY